MEIQWHHSVFSQFWLVVCIKCKMSSEHCFNYHISNVTDPLVVWFFSEVACYQYLFITYVLKWLIWTCTNPHPLFKGTNKYIVFTCNGFLQSFFFFYCLCVHQLILCFIKTKVLTFYLLNILKFKVFLFALRTDIY